jgi:hypothetical protein
MSQQEAEAYGEMNTLLEHVTLTYSHRADAIRAVLETQRALRLTQSIPAAAP